MRMMPSGYYPGTARGYHPSCMSARESGRGRSELLEVHRRTLTNIVVATAGQHICRRIHRYMAALLLASGLCVSSAHAEDEAKKFELTSPSFRDGGTLPDSTVLAGLDCHGPNRSPALEWKNVPAGTKSIVVICDDFEARGGDGFVHWALYNIPATVTRLSDNAGAAEPDLSDGGRHAFNDFLRRRFDGPCPPEGPPHKYRFTVFALKVAMIDDAGTPMTWRKLRFVIHDEIIAQVSLTGLRGH